MRIAIHARLVEEAVFHACRAAAARGDGAPERWLRRALDRAYRLPEGRDRERRFDRAHALAFRRMGLSRALHDILAAHPALSLAGGPVRVGPAPGRAKEGVELHGRRGDDGRPARAVVVSVLPATLADPAEAARRLHREAAKTADLLDPAFAWAEEPPEPTPARREAVRIRYGAAWDAWTDGRLRRRGLPTPGIRGESEGRFAAVYGGALGAAGAATAFDALRTSAALTHADLLRFARDPGGSPPGTPAPPTSAEGRAPPPHAPGSPCPFCRFPTHDWAPAPGLLPDAILDALRSASAGWTPADGICGQCALLFRSRTAGPRGLPGGGSIRSTVFSTG